MIFTIIGFLLILLGVISIILAYRNSAQDYFDNPIEILNNNIELGCVLFLAELITTIGFIMILISCCTFLLER